MGANRRASRRAPRTGFAPEHFDRDYYRRFYHDPATRVVDADDVEKLCRFVVAYLEFLDVPIQRVLDLGCGIGLWRDALEDACPNARYTGVEVSPYLCDEYGWRRGSVVDFRANGGFDLVICQGVLQYLDDADAERAIQNLARLCRGALFLEVLTRADWERNCDRQRTDGAVHLRTGDWYRERLAGDFVNCGGGVFARRGSTAALFELETLDRDGPR